MRYYEVAPGFTPEERTFYNTVGVLLIICCVTAAVVFTILFLGALR